MALAEQARRHEQPRVRIGEADRSDSEAAETERCDQEAAWSEPVGEIAHRHLSGDGDDRADGQGETQLDKSDPPSLPQKQEQRRQHQRVEMADEMCCRDQPDRLNFAAPLDTRDAGRIRDHAAALLRPRYCLSIAATAIDRQSLPGSQQSMSSCGRVKSDFIRSYSLRTASMP